MKSIKQRLVYAVLALFVVAAVPLSGCSKRGIYEPPEYSGEQVVSPAADPADVNDGRLPR